VGAASTARPVGSISYTFLQHSGSMLTAFFRDTHFWGQRLCGSSRWQATIHESLKSTGNMKISTRMRPYGYRQKVTEFVPREASVLRK
jgi:hypothetical protein